MEMTRRTALASAIAATAAPAGAVIPIRAQTDQSAWNAALARLERAEADCAAKSAKHSAVEAAAEAECPYRADFFSRYNLGAAASLDARERNLERATVGLLTERAKGRRLTDAQMRELVADADAIVSEFDVWRAEREKAFAPAAALEEVWEQSLDERCAAQDAVLTTPAPDRQALLAKIELLAGIMEEANTDDAERLATIRTDARRLLAA